MHGSNLMQNGASGHQLPLGHAANAPRPSPQLAQHDMHALEDAAARLEALEVPSAAALTGLEQLIEQQHMEVWMSCLGMQGDTEVRKKLYCMHSAGMSCKEETTDMPFH